MSTTKQTKKSETTTTAVSTAAPVSAAPVSAAPVSLRELMKTKPTKPDNDDWLTINDI